MDQQDGIPFCAGPDPAPRKPAFEMPSGACDTHFHLFPTGYENRYVPDRSYTPPPAELPDYQQVAAMLGLERGVVVQPSIFARDNAVSLEVSSADPERRRAVVSVTKEVTDPELEAFHAAGERGIRVNAVDIGGMTFPSVGDAIAFTARIVDLGWHIEFLEHVETFKDIGALLDMLSDWGCDAALRKQILVDNPALLYGFPDLRG